MSKQRLVLVGSILVSFLGFSTNAAKAAPSFQQAIADYNAGKYSQALAEFKQFAAAYPTNAMSHYYMALCYQSTNQRAEARQEFNLTRQYGDATLKGYADKALASLGGAGSISSGSSVTSKTISTATPSTSSAPAPATAAAVAEVKEFYTDW